MQRSKKRKLAREAKLDDQKVGAIASAIFDGQEVTLRDLELLQTGVFALAQLASMIPMPVMLPDGRMAGGRIPVDILRAVGRDVVTEMASQAGLPPQTTESAKRVSSFTTGLVQSIVEKSKAREAERPRIVPAGVGDLAKLRRN